MSFKDIIFLKGGMMENLVLGYYRICIWITRFAYVNILWVAFTVLGLFVFGFMPATAAMFSVLRKWVNRDHEIPIFQTFWETYKKEFVQANIFGYLIAIIGYVLYIDLQFLRAQEGFLFMLSYGILILFFAYFIIILYAFPMFVHFKLKLHHYLKWSFIIGFVHPVMTILMAIGSSVAIYFIYVKLPALALFFGGSVIAYVLMWGAAQTFYKVNIKGPDETQV